MGTAESIPNIPGLTSKQLKELRRAAEEELQRPPRIAMLGECGVGKSSTLNALFNAGLPTDHVVACTQEAKELHIDVSELAGKRGAIKVYDMPGLNESIAADALHEATYRRVLAECDVAVWVLDGFTRRYRSTQEFLRDVVRVAMGDLSRLVIGINKIDTIEPGKWNDDYNMPSITQVQSIERKITDVRRIIGEICSVPASRIVPYSAHKWYHLEDLLGAMLEACPKERAWVLYDRARVADFLQKVNPKILESVKRKS